MTCFFLRALRSYAVNKNKAADLFSNNIDVLEKLAKNLIDEAEIWDECELKNVDQMTEEMRRANKKKLQNEFLLSDIYFFSSFYLSCQEAGIKAPLLDKLKTLLTLSYDNFWISHPHIIGLPGTDWSNVENIPVCMKHPDRWSRSQCIIHQLDLEHPDNYKNKTYSHLRKLSDAFTKPVMHQEGIPQEHKSAQAVALSTYLIERNIPNQANLLKYLQEAQAFYETYTREREDVESGKDDFTDLKYLYANTMNNTLKTLLNEANINVQTRIANARQKIKAAKTELERAIQNEYVRESNESYSEAIQHFLTGARARYRTSSLFQSAPCLLFPARRPDYSATAILTQLEQIAPRLEKPKPPVIGSPTEGKG